MTVKLEKKLSNGYALVTVFMSMLAACVAAFAFWTWWTSFDTPHIYPRPHPVMWDIVSMNLRARGISAAPGTHDIDDNPLALFAVWTMKNFGGDYRAITVAQIPFLFLLLISTGFVAWRLGGALAGALAPWIALLGPMSIGLAVHFDDLLMLQAMIAASMALLVWSDFKKLWWLSLLIVIPLSLGMKLALYYSNALFFLCFFTCAAGFWLASRWIKWSHGGGGRNAKRVSGAPWLQTVSVVIGLIGAFCFVKFIDYGALIESAFHERFTHLSVTQNWKAAGAAWLLWQRSMAGPTLSVLTVLSFAVGLLKRKWLDLLTPAGWLFVPIVILTFLPKRNDFYLCCAVPATYVLIAAGFGALSKVKVKAVVFLLAMTLIGLSWFQWIESEERGERVQDLNPLFENIPFPYLISPMRFPRYDVAELGEILSIRCGAKGVPVIFVKGGDLDGWEAFYAWHADPDLAIGDIKAAKIPRSENACLVGQFHLGDARPFTIDQLTRHFAADAPVHIGQSRKIRGRIDRIHARLDSYRLIQVYNLWGIFYGPGFQSPK